MIRVSHDVFVLFCLFCFVVVVVVFRLRCVCLNARAVVCLMIEVCFV